MCICCDKKISLLYPEIDLASGKLEEDVIFNTKEKIQIDGDYDQEITVNAGSKMWNDGLVHKVSAGYGSCHDGDEFIIAICDDCIKKKKLTGNIAYVDNYMGYPLKGDEDYEKSRIAWRRYNRIDDILDDNKETQ